MHLKKRVLVTGGAGFLGSHLCEKLLDERIEVLCVDNFFTGAKQN
ncbi:MAG: NAD-dependent epimerase/dehydratase family protein, partial [Proteobacteria bacterium]|nr:NAD-dependent epimerase/dehydratase family protein [Pseudomonadota bacterium]